MPPSDSSQTFRQIALGVLDKLQRDLKAGIARQRWADTPIAFLEIPPPIRCPFCGHDRPPIIIRSIDQGDGSRLRRLVCRRCSGRFRVVLEPALPAAGKTDQAGPYTSGKEAQADE